jgi:hypothetical protein
MTFKEVDNVCQNSVPYFPEEKHEDRSNVSSSESAVSRILTQIMNCYISLRGIGFGKKLPSRNNASRFLITPYLEGLCS